MKKKKLIWHIFPSFLIITAISLFTVTFYTTQYFKKIYLQNTEHDLVVRTKLVRQKFQGLNDQLYQNGNIHKICKEVGEQTDMRVTIILPSGKVIGDSFSEPGQMENHRTRSEIKTALKRKKGVSIRYSQTLDQNMMYIALPLVDNNRVIAVVRTSISISTIDKEISIFLKRIFYVFGFITIVSALASLYVSRRITRPIVQMREGALNFASGQLETRLPVPETQELFELATTMNDMAARLNKKINQFRTRGMELEAIYASMIEGVLAIDMQKKIITINKTAAKIFGVPLHMADHRHILEIARQISFQEFIQNALLSDDPCESDIVIDGKNEQIILSTNSRALFNAEDERIGTLIIFHDITRIKRLENMHKDFAANVSHELKTPMTSIKGFVETLQDMIAQDNFSQDAGHFLNIINKNVNRIIALVNDLLSLSKLERMEGKDTKFETHNLMHLIDCAVNQSYPNVSKNKLDIEINCPKDLTARLDPILMERALGNLIENAVKYSPAGKKIVIRVWQENNALNISVQDYGQGIREDHLYNIFKRFYRVDKGRSRDQGGTGLGLAIVKHIIQYHNGTIDVKSTLEEGSTFTIKIIGPVIC